VSNRSLGISSAAAFAALAFASPAAAQSAGPLASQSFQIGTAGAQCEAQGVRLGEARASVYDRKWALICSDVERPIGAAYSWRSASDVERRVSLSRGTALDCGEAGGTPDATPGVTFRRCRDPKTGLEWNSYTAVSGGRTDVVEGFAAFDSALRLALANLMQDRIVPGEVAIVTTGGSGSLAEARASLGDAALLIGQGYHRNNAGEYVEAEEYFQPELLAELAKQNPQAASRLVAERHEVLVNRALQLSNLGRYAEAAKLFGQADAMGLRDPIQARLLRNFEAIDAINRAELASATAILQRPVPALATPAAAEEGAVAIDPALADSLNAGLASGLTDAVSQETRLTTVERAAIIDAQARQLSGTVLRLQGKPDQALAELTAAQDQILAIKEGRVLSTARLRAQVMSEMALAQEARGGTGEAEQLLRNAVTLLELRYPESASVSGAKARLAAFLTRHDKPAEAMQLYRSVVASTIGERDALIGVEHQMAPYFRMLVEQLPQRPELVSDLFEAAQLVERPGAAQTLSQLTRRLAAGDSQASDLFRRATNVDRELNRTNLAIAQVQAGDQNAPSAQLADLQAEQKRLQQAQLELVDALSAYPAYRSLAHNYVTADELRALLKPGEGYLKLVQLDDEMFAVNISPERSTGWRVAASSQEVADLVSKLRDSISLTIGGVTATYPFDVDSSRQLYGALFGPVAGDLPKLRHLIFEPDGALLQLPINLLIADQAGVDAYHKRVEAGGDEFDFRGLAWLGRDEAISTALSPASFRDARRAPSSMAGKTYLGLGQNQPVGNLTRAALTRGVPTEDEGCELPLAAWNRPIPADELKLASQVLGPGRSELLTGAAFTDTAIEHDPTLNQYRIVHFATHGIVTAPKPACPARPALLTSFGGQGSDGLLGFVEIFDLKLDADLVILSACNTASTAGLDVTREAGIESGGGQALDGLVRAFIGAGGRQVIASHWPAPEEYGATRRLFESFFESPPGTNVGDALLAAQRKLMDDPQTSHPFYWSGFALVGDGERPLLPRS
jgi:CHAT domain-containing protein/tetratricopeptide (TPR) repeat protein